MVVGSGIQYALFVLFETRTESESWGEHQIWGAGTPNWRGLDYTASYESMKEVKSVFLRVKLTFLVLLEKLEINYSNHHLYNKKWISWN